jgi:site-specific recombinase XerD
LVLQPSSERRQNDFRSRLLAPDVVDEAALDGELSDHPWTGPRNQAVLLLLYGSGLRVSEALDLNRKDAPLGPRDVLRIKGIGHLACRLAPLGRFSRLETEPEKALAFVGTEAPSLLPAGALLPPKRLRLSVAARP